MTVVITFSETSGGDSLSDTESLGTSISPSSDTDTQDIYVRSNAVVNPITDCAWYLTRYAGTTYLGSDADADFTEIMGWGDASSGGAKINQVAPSFGSGDDQVFKNGYGDIDSQLILDEDSIVVGTPAGDGVLPVGAEAHVQFRVSVPASVPSGSGYRAVSLVFAYSATS